MHDEIGDDAGAATLAIDYAADMRDGSWNVFPIEHLLHHIRCRLGPRIVNAPNMHLGRAGVCAAVELPIDVIAGEQVDFHPQTALLFRLDQTP